MTWAALLCRSSDEREQLLYISTFIGRFMSEKSVSYNGGVGVAGLLGVVFVTLKLTGFIDWSWWWVTAPFWGGLAIVLVIVLCLLIAGVVAWALDRK